MPRSLPLTAKGTGEIVLLRTNWKKYRWDRVSSPRTIQFGTIKSILWKLFSLISHSCSLCFRLLIRFVQAICRPWFASWTLLCDADSSRRPPWSPVFLHCDDNVRCHLLQRFFFCPSPLPFGGSTVLESYSRTSGESNHHRQSVSDTRMPRYQLSHEDDWCHLLQRIAWCACSSDWSSKDPYPLDCIAHMGLATQSSYICIIHVRWKHVFHIRFCKDSSVTHPTPTTML